MGANATVPRATGRHVRVTRRSMACPGPRPSRPGSLPSLAVAPSGGRRLDVERCSTPARSRQRVVRAAAGAPVRRRRIVAMIALALVASLAVVALGLLAAVSGAGAVPARSAPVVVAAGDTVWALARRAAPDADPVAVVERIVADNGLTSPVLRPGQVVSVPVGD